MKEKQNDIYASFLDIINQEFQEINKKHNKLKIKS